MAEICYSVAIRCRFRNFYQICNYTHCRRSVFRNCSTSQTSSSIQGCFIKEVGDKCVEKHFFDPHVQRILTKITGLDLEKIYRARKQKLSVPVYKFVTGEKLAEEYIHFSHYNAYLELVTAHEFCQCTSQNKEDNRWEEILELKENAKEKALEKLQMPPVFKEREPINDILSKNPELQGLNDSKIVFTDITLGVSNRDRFIAVRDPDGTLRKANWDERFRMNQIFFPIAGRQFYTPKLFEVQHLEPLLDQQNYEFVLDYACLQFEPDDPEYIRVAQTTYEHVNKSKQFDTLRSTRHFGPMAFYLASKKNIDSLLLDMIERQLIGDAADLLKLLYILHPDSASQESEASDLDLIKDFIQSQDIRKRSQLELALQTYQEIQEQQMALLEKHKPRKEANIN